MSNDKELLEAVASELTAIKRLLIYGLVRAGASQRDVAAALGVNQSTISRMFPPRLFKPPRKKKAN